MSPTWYRWIGLAAALSGIAVTFWIFSYIEDWSRDLSTNVAETDSHSPDKRMHPVRVAVPAAEFQKHLRTLPEALPHWTVAEESPEGELPAVTKFVRSTSILGFKDDITVTLTPDSDPAYCIISAHSKSRVGKGDLGQNPRNIRELTKWIAEN